MTDALWSPALLARLRAADVPDETLYLAGEAAGWAAALSDDERRAWALLVVASLEAHRRGDTRLRLPPSDAPDDVDLPGSKRGDEQFLSTLLATLGIASDERRRTTALAARLRRTPALEPIVGGAGDYKPFIVDDGCLYHQRVLAVEERLAQTLRRRLEEKSTPITDAELARALAAAGTSDAGLADEQRAAVKAALTQPLTIVSGGPGTGKTSVIVAVLRAATALGLAPADIALAAPTGKAAQRINESVAARQAGVPGPGAQTLHRLLGYTPAGGGRFRHHRHYPLPHKLIVVDEGSMIDLFLMERLLGAVAADARLVLLGDAHQLPSVDAGAVFRDLAPLAITLTRSYRMDPATTSGRAILTAAEAIRLGRGAALDVPARARAADLAFAGVELLAPPPPRPGAPTGRWTTTAALDDFFSRWQARAQEAQPEGGRTARATYAFHHGSLAPEQAPALTAAYAHQHDHRILCVTRSAARATGADAVNAAFHQRGPHPGDGPFAAGEPLLMLRNDYDRGLFNGDLGLCVRATFDGGDAALAAVFPRGDRFVAFPLVAVAPDLALAYALTVHRAQGSEVTAIALILPDDDLPLLTRELLYTALTRARASATIVGRPNILQQALARQNQRSTGLAGRLNLGDS